MIPSVLALIAVAAFVCTILAAMAKCPEWVAVLLLSVGMLLLAAVPLVK